ncbi:tripartite tricarboxylate transporter substrate binding protein [Bacillus sp. JJ1533]|uniref:tripartite tricarboxylate transporter substrate binding protein n=1 Tax=Bacillus sp. JJ1533 TaxID=3122959 RepID=UPI002FFD75EC
MSEFKLFFRNILVLGLLITLITACSSNTNSNGVSESEGAKKESTYPEKPVTFVAPSGAGGAFDTALRSFTKVLTDTKIVEQQLTVEVKPGGGGSVFLAEYATQDVDNNYKLFLTSPTMLINHLKKDGNSPYGYQDTTPIATLFQDYGVIAVSADSQFNDLKSLFDYMKENPSDLSVAGGSAPGAVDHLSFLIPATDYGLNGAQLKYVPYDGKAESMTALLGGNADVLTSVASSVSEFLEAGKIKVLAVDAPERLPGAFADVPTMKELGINSDFAVWRGIFGPKNMTEEAKAYWEEKIAELVETDEWKAELEAKGWEHFYNDSEAFMEILKKQEESIKKVLDQLGMTK